MPEAVLNTDAILWYNVGVYGQLGYAVPNPSDDRGSLNPTIIEAVELVGRNLFAIMHMEDIDFTRPPQIDVIRKVHKLYMRFGQLITARAVPPGENPFRPVHTTPAGEIFKVYPVPYFKVRNPHMKGWTYLMLMMLSEMMQHTENRMTMDITTVFAADAGKYMTRLYSRIATDLFGKTREEAMVPGFLLTEAELTAYDPMKWHTSTELIDTVPNLGAVFTEDKKAPLAAGIPITSLPTLQPWPTNVVSYYQANVPIEPANMDQVVVNDPNATAAADRSGGGPIFPSVEP